jgi:hypothetical protein
MRSASRVSYSPRIQLLWRSKGINSSLDSILGLWFFNQLITQFYQDKSGSKFSRFLSSLPTYPHYSIYSTENPTIPRIFNHFMKVANQLTRSGHGWLTAFSCTSLVSFILTYFSS